MTAQKSVSQQNRKRQAPTDDTAEGDREQVEMALEHEDEKDNPSLFGRKKRPSS